jgi:hypothetical protein
MEQSQFRPPKPDNYLVWAILTTIFCCLPFGIVSIVQASKVDTLYYNGQYDEAEVKSKEAKKWAIISAASILAIFVIYVMIAIIVGFSIFSFGDHTYRN